MKLRQSERTLVTLANASELVVNISRAVIGNEVADTFNGENLTGSLIHDLAQSTFHKSLSKYIGRP